MSINFPTPAHHPFSNTPRLGGIIKLSIDVPLNALDSIIFNCESSENFTSHRSSHFSNEYDEITLTKDGIKPSFRSGNATRRTSKSSLLGSDLPSRNFRLIINYI